MAQSTQFRQSAEAAILGHPTRGLWRNTWYRLRRNRLAMLGLGIIALFTGVAILAPVLAPHNPFKWNLDKTYLPPAWITQAESGPNGDPRFLLGTDKDGRDLLSRGVYGTQTSMFVGLAAAPLVALVGVSIGLIAGYAGGRVDNLIMRITDVFYAFPSIMFYILIMLIFRFTVVGRWLNGLVMILLALTLIGWVGLARLVRSVVLSLKESEFVEAARCIGASDARILAHHILPNCMGVVLVWMTMAVPRLIMVEAILGYLGIGIKPALDDSQSFFVTSWGGLFLDGRGAINSHPFILVVPTVCIALVGTAFTFLGDGLRDALDPHMRDIA